MWVPISHEWTKVIYCFLPPAALPWQPAQGCAPSLLMDTTGNPWAQGSSIPGPDKGCTRGQELWQGWCCWCLCSCTEAVTLPGVKQGLSRHHQWIYTSHLLNAQAVKFHLSSCAALPSQINFINSSFYAHHKAPFHIWALFKRTNFYRDLLGSEGDSPSTFLFSSLDHTLFVPFKGSLTCDTPSQALKYCSCVLQGADIEHHHPQSAHKDAQDPQPSGQLKSAAGKPM